MAGREVRAGKAFVEIALRDRLEAGLKRISARLRGFAAGVGAIGRPLLALGAGLGAPLALATGVFAGFDDQMRLVKAVTQATDDEFARLRTTAQELGRTTSFTSAQVAGLMTELGRAGFNPDQIDRMTASVLDLAKATGTDATLASGIMAASIRQFSLDAGDAGRVADALTVAANKSFNTLESLGEALTYAGPVASDFNMSIEDTLALLGALGNVGIQGSNAGTALRRLLTLSGAEAEKLKEIFGVSFVDMRGNARPLVDVLDEVNQATKDLGTAARAQKFNEAFGLLGITGASALSKNAVNVRELRDALANANGVAARTHKEMESGLGGTFRRILSAAEGVAIAIGDALAPALQRLEPIVTTVLGSITKWIGEHKTLVTVVAASVAAIAGIGGVLVAIAGAASLAAFAVSGAATVWSIATGALAAIGTVIGAIVSPIGLLVAGVVAAGAAFLYFSGVGGKVIRWLQTRFGELVGFVTKVAGDIGDALMAGDMKRAATILWDAIKVAFARGVEEVSALWKAVQASAQQAWAGVRAAAGRVISWFASAWATVRSSLAALGQTAGAAFQAVTGMVGSAIRTAIQFVQSLPVRFVEALRRVPSIAASVFSTLGGIVRQAISVATSAVEWLPAIMASAIAAIPQLIGTMFRGIARAVSALAELVPTPLRNFVQAGAGVVSEVGSLFGRFASVVGAVLTPIATVARTAFRGVVNAASFVFSAIKAIVTPIATVLAGAFRLGVAIAANIIGGLVMIVARVASTILSIWSSVIGTVGQIVSRLVRVVSTVASRVVQIASRTASLFAGPFAGLVTAIGDFFSAAVELGGTILSNLVAIASQVGSAILAALARPLEALRSVWQRVTETARAAWSGLTSLATGVANAIGNAFSTVANVVRTAFGNVWQFLAASASQVVAFFGRAMSAVGQAGAAVANGFAATFTQMKNATLETFSAIGTALAEGDFALAAEIAWASIKLAFAQGMAWVTNAWTEFSTGLAMIFDGVITSIRQVWNNISTWIARQMLKLVGMIHSAVAKLAEIDPTGLSDKLAAALDFDVEGTIRILEEDSQRFNQGIEQAKSARDDERVRAMQQQLAETDKRLAELREARRQALAKADALAEDDTKSPLAGAIAELEKTLADATNMDKLFDANAAQSQLPLAFGGMPKLGGSAGLAGTFNAAIAGMLGRSGDDPGERTADAVESMDEKLTDIRDELKDRPVLAFDT